MRDAYLRVYATYLECVNIYLECKMSSKFIIIRFCNLNRFQDDDALQPVLRNNSIVMNELRTWQRLQKSQSILLDGK